jgi:hypothetical protein
MTAPHPLRLTSAALVGLALLAAPLAAGDGVVEINQTVVEQGLPPCNGGAGFPCVIDKGGSYRLTGNLEAPAGYGGISIAADNVTLDLGGFTVQGHGGATSGIAAAVSTIKGVAVTHGVVTGFAAGVALADSSRVVEVTASGNTGHGISVGRSSQVDRCVARGNTLYGIWVVEGSRVTGCNADSTLVGFAAVGSIVTASTASGNSGDGFEFTGSVLTDNVAVGNGSNGFISMITGNPTRRCHLSRSIALSNTGLGLQAMGNLAYEDNTFANNNGGGDQLSAGAADFNLGGNTCGYALCP